MTSMKSSLRFVRVAAITILVGSVANAQAGSLSVVTHSPAASSLNVPVDAPIVVHFSQPLNPATLIVNQSVNGFGRWSGVVTGSIEVAGDGLSFTWTPSRAFSAGELVTVTLSHDIAAMDGSPLRSAGYSFQFWTNSRPAAMSFAQVDSHTTRTIPAESSRAYGGIGSDLNEDGFLDITVVNEDTADLRVFLNQGDRTGMYEDFIQPTFPVEDRASPSEPADFNRDGHVDICVANINTARVSILLGNGDGSFGTQQQVTVANAPRGVAVLDVDGDGDMDIANTNAGGSSVSILINNGSGVFTLQGSFDSGAQGEWGLATADMDQDGILDLVVGAQTNRKIVILRGNGNGTFTFVSMQESDGPVWMLAVGDLNGDGYEDVTTANSQFNRSAVLFGDGTGHLSTPMRYTGESFTIATDVGDLDGDGDLDWVTSSYGGDWRIYLNDGNGMFSFFGSVPSPVAASCAVLMDIDNDGDLDMTLIDEEQDVVILMKNSGTAPFLGDYDDDCHVALADYSFLDDCVGGPSACAAMSCIVFDYDDDCHVDMRDFVRFQVGFTGEGETLEGCAP